MARAGAIPGKAEAQRPLPDDPTDRSREPAPPPVAPRPGLAGSLHDGRGYTAGAPPSRRAGAVHRALRRRGQPRRRLHRGGAPEPPASPAEGRDPGAPPGALTVLEG